MPDPLIPVELPRPAPAPLPAAAPGEIVAVFGEGPGRIDAATALLAPGATRLGPGAALFPWLCIGDNVGFGPTRLDAFAREGLVAHALARVGLAGTEALWPHELTPAQRHGVAVARLLVARPKALLLDEPFRGLSPDERGGLFDLLLRHWQETRPCIVLATDDLDRALLLADRILVLRGASPFVAAGFINLQPRPRDRAGIAFQALKREVERALRSVRVAVAA